MKIKLTASCIICFFTYSSVAQDTAARMLNEVTVTSQRTAAKKLYVPYAVETVSPSHLENYLPRSTPEALMSTNGVFVQKTNHGGGSPFLRGLTGNQALILVDGIRLNNSTFRYGPNQYLNTIDPYSIHKIEVVKGSGSVQYGSDAMGGVVHVITKEPAFTENKGTWHANGTLKYMSHDMEKTARAEGIYSSKSSAVQLGATYRSFGDLIGGDTTGRQSPSGYNEFAFDAKTKFLIQGNTELTLAHQFLRQLHVPVFHKVVLENFAENEFHPQQRMLTYAKLKISGARKVFNKIEFTGSWQNSLEGRESRKNGSNTLRKETDKVQTFGFTADVHSSFTNAWTANSGIEVYHDKVNSKRQDINPQDHAAQMLRGLYPDDSRYSNYSLYSLHHLNLNRFTFEGGVRLNTFAINITDTSVGKVKISPSCFVYNASLMYKVSGVHHVYAGVNTGYRAPNVDDMGTLGIVDFRYEVPAYNLNPERSRNFEIGYKMQSARLAASVAGYYMQLDNLVTRIRVEGQEINGYPVYVKENVDEGYVKGLEAEINYEPVSNLLVTAGGAYAYGQSITRNEPLRRIPPFFGRVSGTYGIKRWFASAEFLFASNQDRLAAGDRDDNRIPRGGTPAWQVLNMYGRYQLHHLHFNIGLQNLFNEDYRYHGSGINGVGRSFWIAVSVRI